MKRVSLFVTCLALLTLISTLASAGNVIRLPGPELETLPNGLTLAWFPAKAIPVIDFVFLFKAGHRWDPPGKSGTSELTVALLDRGAAGKSEIALSQEIESLGGSRFASVDEDALTVGVHGLAPDAEKLFGFLTDITLHPDFPETELKRERERTLESWFKSVDSSESLASLAFQRLVTAGTEYARGSMAQSSELKRVARADLVKFHREAMAPKGAVLAIVGRYDRARLRALIDQKLANWRGAPAAHHEAVVWKDPALPTLAPGEVLLVDRPGLTQAQIRYGFPSVTAKDPARGALAVVNALLGEYFESRLNKQLRDKDGLTYGVGSAFAFGKDAGRFFVSTATRNEHAGRALRKIQELVSGTAGAEPPTEEEVRIAKEFLEGQFPLSVSTTQGIAIRWLTGVAYDLGQDYLNEFLGSIDRVTLAEARNTAQRLLKSSRPSSVVVGDAKLLEPVLKQSGFKIKRCSGSSLLR